MIKPLFVESLFGMIVFIFLPLIHSETFVRYDNDVLDDVDNVQRKERIRKRILKDNFDLFDDEKSKKLHFRNKGIYGLENLKKIYQKDEEETVGQKKVNIKDNVKEGTEELENQNKENIRDTVKEDTEKIENQKEKLAEDKVKEDSEEVENQNKENMKDKVKEDNKVNQENINNINNYVEPQSNNNFGKLSIPILIIIIILIASFSTLYKKKKTMVYDQENEPLLMNEEFT